MPVREGTPAVRKAVSSKGVSGMIYSIPGVGKTQLLGTGGSDMLLIRPPTDHPPRAINPDVDETIIQGHADLENVHSWIAREAHKKYRWAALDSLSLFQDHGLQDLFEDAVATNPGRAKAGLDKKEYGLNQQRIGTFIRNMVGLATEGKINFLITAHPMEWYNPETESDMWAPLIQGGDGKFMNKIVGMMNFLAYYDEKDGKRTLRFQSKRDLYLKDQVGFPPRILNPTMADIDAVIEKNKPPQKRRETTTTAKRRTRRRRK